VTADIFEDELLDGKILDSLEVLHVFLVFEILEVNLDDGVGVVHLPPYELIANFDLLFFCTPSAPPLYRFVRAHIELEQHAVHVQFKLLEHF
jgi:hypothetical protein